MAVPFEIRILDLIAELLAHALIVFCPLYSARTVSARPLKSFLDRLFYSTRFDKRMKVGAAVTSARRAGTIATFDIINKYFSIAQMPIATSFYWNEVHGANAEQVVQDEEGMQCMRQLGRNMAFLIRAIAAEKALNGLPEQEPRVWTNFIS